jgi:DNA polymerase III alpha subunit (gram-positive type)
MSFRFPYLSIDVETTGLDRSFSHVVQLAAIYDNGKAVGDLPTFNRLIRWPVLKHCEEYALNMNRDLIQSAFLEKASLVRTVAADFADWLNEIQPGGKFTPAGKNVDGFDLVVLRNPINDFKLDRLNRRCLDPGSMYAEDFDHIPSLDEINKLIGRGKVSHDALDDCWDVVYAIRHKWNV